MLLKKCDSCWSKSLEAIRVKTIQSNSLGVKACEACEAHDKPVKLTKPKLIGFFKAFIWPKNNCILPLYMAKSAEIHSCNVGFPNRITLLSTTYTFNSTYQHTPIFSVSAAHRIGPNLKFLVLFLLVCSALLQIIIDHSWIFSIPHQKLQVQWHCVHNSHFDRKRKTLDK